MTVHEWARLTWEEVRALDTANAVAVLPVGALEAHGPHLPLATDVIIAEAMARNGAARLSERGLTVLILPALAYTPARYAKGFVGTMDVASETVTALVNEVSDGVGRAGIPLLLLANAHFDPRNVQALRGVADPAARSRPPRIVFADLTRRACASRLTDEFRSGACHAGRYEGSIVLAAAPDLVRTDIMRDLEPNPRSLSDAAREGRHTFEEAGGDRAYFGWPADATADEGRETIATLGAILEEIVLETREGLGA
jgi:creatinine amidohydrolase